MEYTNVIHPYSLASIAALNDRIKLGWRCALHELSQIAKSHEQGVDVHGFAWILRAYSVDPPALALVKQADSNGSRLPHSSPPLLHPGVQPNALFGFSKPI